MKVLKVLSVAVLALVVASCGKKSDGATPENSSASTNDSTITASPDSSSAVQPASADTLTSSATEQSASPDAAQVESFLKDFYSKYIFKTKKSNMSFEEAVQASCTKALQKHLQDAYEYECEDGPCYAETCFLSGLQDGPSEVSKLIRVVPADDSWYKVTYLDMGNKATTRIHCILEDGKLKMDKIKEANN